MGGGTKKLGHLGPGHQARFSGFLRGGSSRLDTHLGAAAGPHESDFVGENDGLNAVAKAELLQDMVHVRLDGRVADHEGPPPRRGETRSNQRQHFELALRQIRECVWDVGTRRGGGTQSGRAGAGGRAGGGGRGQQRRGQGCDVLADGRHYR